MPPGRPRGGGRGLRRARGSVGGPGRTRSESQAQSSAAPLDDDGGEDEDRSEASIQATLETVPTEPSSQNVATVLPTVEVNATANGTQPRSAGLLRPGGSAAAPTPATSSLSARLRPKNVRRSEAEREQIAKEELEKQQRRLRQDAQLKARARGFRGRRPRGQGPFLGGRPEFITRTVSSTGISFESPSAPPKTKGKAAQGTKQSGEASAGRNSSKVKEEPAVVNGYSSAVSYRDERSRVNADLLNSYTHEYYEDMAMQGGEGGTERRKRPLMPMGLLRAAQRDPKDVASLENTAQEPEEADAGPEPSDESDLYVDDPNRLHINDVDLQDDNEVWEQAAPRQRRTRKIKKESDVVDENVESLDAGRSRQGATSAKRQGKIPVNTKGAKQDAKPILDAEEAFITTDLEKMLKGLGRVSDDLSSEGRPLDNKLFLFQFPPVLPPLTETAPGSHIKLEADDDVVMADRPAKVSSSVVDLTGDGSSSAIKIEDAEDNRPGEMHSALRDVIGEGGYVGQLNVRRSGKVELSWGGRILEVVPGDDLMALTTAVITEQSEGKAYGMGRIEGKFVLAPAFGDEEDWVVDPDDLVIE